MPDIFIAKEKGEKISSPVKNVEIKHQSSPRRKMHFLKAFAENPHGVSFANQKGHEQIVLLLRGHLITNFLWFSVFILLLIFPIFYFLLFKNIYNPLSLVSEKFTYFFIAFYYLIVFAYALFNFLNWFYNIMIITNLGVIDIDFSDLLYHDVAFTNFNLIEDVNYTKTGFFRSLFNFGDVFVQTAGGKENLEALGIPNPAKATHIISDSIGKGEGSG